MLALEGVDWFSLWQTADKGPVVMTGSLGAVSWPMTTAVLEPPKFQERCKMEFQSLFWTDSKVLIEPILWIGYNWGRGITWL